MAQRSHRNSTVAESPSAFRAIQHTPPVRLLLKGFMAATGFMPVWMLRAVGLLFVVLFMAFTPGNVRAIMANLRHIKPDWGRLRDLWGALEVYKNYSYYLIDLFYISHDPDRRIKEYTLNVQGNDKMEKCVSSGKGLVLLTTHLGNWEVGGFAIDLHGRPIHMIYSPDSSDILERQRKGARWKERIVEIPLKPGQFSSLKLLRVLQEGGIVAVQGDRTLMDRGAEVDFFGAPARFPQGPVKIGSLSGSYIIPAFIPMIGYKKYNIIVAEPLEFAESDEVEYCLSRVTKVFEQYISQYPTQWYTFMPFWDEDKKRLGFEA